MAHPAFFKMLTKLLTRGGTVSPTVLLLGLTSMFTDISTEMVNSILPLFLISQLGFSTLHFGIFDGLYHGITALLRIGSAHLADRHRRYKEVAEAGYALSAICKLGLWMVGSASAAVLAVLFLDRLGKGIRTAPRDALISLSVPPSGLGTAFGLHRALDTAGAFLGPVVAFMLLAATPAAYDVVFITSFFIALIGLAILFFFVVNVESNSGKPNKTETQLFLSNLIILLGAAKFRAVLLAGAALSFATISDSFIYLTLQRSGSMQTYYFPLLFVGTAMVYFLLAVPAGRLADRIGRQVVFIAGHALLVALYGVLLLTRPGPVEIAISLLLLGGYYAATDGVLMAIASAVLPAAWRTTGLAFLTTATALARLFGSVLYGAVWSWHGSPAAISIFLVALLAAAMFAAAILIRTHTRTTE
jgi:MFS family permease